MYKKSIKIHNTEGNFIEDVFVFENRDKEQIKNIYLNWIKIDTQLRQLGGRRLSFPVEIVEAIVCIELNMYKIDNNRIYSDLYDPNLRHNISVKVGTNETYRMPLSYNEIMENDQIFFVKLDIGTNQLKYEIIEFLMRDVKEYILNQKTINLQDNRRILMQYRELMQIKNTIILKGFL